MTRSRELPPFERFPPSSFLQDVFFFQDSYVFSMRVMMAPRLHQWKHNSSSLSELRTCWKRPQAIHNCHTFILRALVQQTAVLFCYVFLCACAYEDIPQVKKNKTKTKQTQKQQLPESQLGAGVFTLNANIILRMVFTSRKQSNRHVLTGDRKQQLQQQGGSLRATKGDGADQSDWRGAA